MEEYPFAAGSVRYEVRRQSNQLIIFLKRINAVKQLIDKFKYR